MEIQGAVVIVIGASSGIGRAIAVRLSKQGAKVVLASPAVQKLEVLSEILPDSYVVPTDISKREDVSGLIQKTIDHYGRIDVLIQAAGRTYVAPVESIDIQRYHEQFQLDVVGPLTAMQELIPILRRERGGLMIHVCGDSPLDMALKGLVQAAHQELSHDHIEVKAVIHRGRTPERVADDVLRVITSDSTS